MNPYDSPHAPLMAALDWAGIEHRDLFLMPFPDACAVILERLRCAGFTGEFVMGVTSLEHAVALIDEWVAREQVGR